MLCMIIFPDSILYFPIPNNALRLGGQAEIQNGWLVRAILTVPWAKTTFAARRTVLTGGIEKKISSSTEFLKAKSYGKYGCFA